jgi:hypothetical protein
MLIENKSALSTDDNLFFCNTRKAVNRQIIFSAHFHGVVEFHFFNKWQWVTRMNKHTNKKYMDQGLDNFEASFPPHFINFHAFVTQSRYQHPDRDTDRASGPAAAAGCDSDQSGGSDSEIAAGAAPIDAPCNDPAIRGARAVFSGCRRHGCHRVGRAGRSHPSRVVTSSP